MSNDEPLPPKDAALAKPEESKAIEVNYAVEVYAGEIKDLFENNKTVKSFHSDKKLEDLAQRAKDMGDKLIADGCSKEYALALSRMTLYDLVMLIDDSSSLNYEQNGVRKEHLKNLVRSITKVYDHANDSGIKSVRFLNHRKGRKDITTDKVDSVFEGRKYYGGTMIGTALGLKIIDPFVWGVEMKKPLLAMIVTDGEVEGEKTGCLKETIQNCMTKLKDDEARGPEAVVFHFTQVGDDPGAKKMLRHLDDCPEIGEFVDCIDTSALSDLENPQLKWRQLTKLFLGALDDHYDSLSGNTGQDKFGEEEYAEIDMEDNDDDDE